jgi:hypothetical protein
VLAVPAILALTLTLCVVDNQADGLGGTECGSERLGEKRDGEGIVVRPGEVGDAQAEEGEVERDEEEEEDMVGKVGNTLHARTITAGEGPTSSSKSPLPSYDHPHEYQGHLHPAHHPQPRLASPTSRIPRRYRGDDDTNDVEEEGRGELEEEAEEVEYRLAEEMRREEEEEDTSHVLKFNKWLTAVQCARESLSSIPQGQSDAAELTPSSFGFELPVGPSFVAGVLFCSSLSSFHPSPLLLRSELSAVLSLAPVPRYLPFLLLPISRLARLPLPNPFPLHSWRPHRPARRHLLDGWKASGLETCKMSSWVLGCDDLGRSYSSTSPPHMASLCSLCRIASECWLTLSSSGCHECRS